MKNKIHTTTDKFGDRDIPSLQLQYIIFPIYKIPTKVLYVLQSLVSVKEKRQLTTGDTQKHK